MVDVDRIDIRSVYPVRMTPDERTELVARMAHNLQTVDRTWTAADAAAGVGWYRVARRVIGSMATVHGVSVSSMAGVVAAASPRLSWYDNLRMADKVHRDRSSISQLIPSSRRPVVAIMNGGRPLSVIRGNKTSSFYRNLLGDMDAVTVDIWMLRAVTGRPDIGDYEYDYIDRVGAYGLVADSVTMAAAACPWPVSPAEYQAAIWIPYRRTYARWTDDRIDMTDTDAALSSLDAFMT